MITVTPDFIILTNEDYEAIYDADGSGEPNLDKSKLSDSNEQMFVQFGRDLHWPEDLVRGYMQNYRYVDPETEYINALVEVLQA